MPNVMVVTAPVQSPPVPDFSIDDPDPRGGETVESAGDPDSVQDTPVPFDCEQASNASANWTPSLIEEADDSDTPDNIWLTDEEGVDAINFVVSSGSTTSVDLASAQHPATDRVTLATSGSSQMAEDWLILATDLLPQHDLNRALLNHAQIVANPLCAFDDEFDLNPVQYPTDWQQCLFT